MDVIAAMLIPANRDLADSFAVLFNPGEPLKKKDQSKSGKSQYVFMGNQVVDCNRDSLHFWGSRPKDHCL